MKDIFDERKIIESLGDATGPVTLEEWFELHKQRHGKLTRSDYHVFCVTVLCEWAAGFGPWRHVHRERKGLTHSYTLDKTRYSEDVA